jgi:hypothetical protein
MISGKMEPTLIRIPNGESPIAKYATSAGLAPTEPSPMYQRVIGSLENTGVIESQRFGKFAPVVDTPRCREQASVNAFQRQALYGSVTFVQT